MKITKIIMKKNLFFIAAAAIALTSCTSEEVVEFNTDNQISFRASFNPGMDARGTETSVGNFNAFYAWAFEKIPNQSDVPLFGNTIFTKNAANTFVCDNPFRWTEKMELQFYAFGYALKSNSEGSTPALPELYSEESQKYFDVVEITPEQATIEFKVDQEIPEHIDLVAAQTVSDKTPMGSSVSLNFTHILSEVQVVARCSAPRHKVWVKGIKFGNIKYKSQYNFWESTWGYTKNDLRSYSVLYYDTPIDLNSSSYDHIHDKGWHDVSKGEKKDVGYAMFLPQVLSTFNATNEDFEGPKYKDKIHTSAQYVALLIKITPIGSDDDESVIKFPITEAHTVPGTDGYGWAYVPLYTAKYPNGWAMGHRYVYHLDFTNGAGYNEDGEDIMQGNVQFTVDLAPWASNDDIYRPESSTPAN